MKKRILSLALCLCMVLGLLPTMALADTSATTISVGGVELSFGVGSDAYWVNDAIKQSDTVPDDWNVKVTKADDGTATLYLKGAKVIDSYNSGISYGSGALNIVVEGENTVTGAFNGISVSGGRLSITGSGTLTVTSSGTLVNTGYGIYDKNDNSALTGISISGSGLTVNATGGTFPSNFSTAQSYGIYACGDGGTVAISDGAAVTAIGGTILSTSASTLQSCGVYAAGGALTVIGASFTAVGGAVSSTASSAVLLSKGICVSSSSGASMTLTNSTVVATGGRSTDCSYGAELHSSGGSLALTVRGGTFSASAADSASTSYGVHMNANNGAEQSIDISGGAFMAADTIQYSNYDSSLTVNPDASLLVESNTIGNLSSILNNGTVYGAAGVKQTIDSTGTMYAYGGDISSATLNLDDSNVPSVTTGYLAGDGYAVWEPTLDKDDSLTSGTLTLNNAAIISTEANGIRFNKDESTVTFALVLEGQNSVSVSSSNAYYCSGIYSDADLTISGDGTLEVSASSAYNGNNCYGIWTDKSDLTISSNVTASAASGDAVTGNHNCGMNVGGNLTVEESCTVTATAGNADYGSEGISVEGDLSLEKSAVVSASSGDAASGYSNGVYGKATLTLGEGAKLSATAGKAGSSYGSMGLWLEPGAVLLGKNATLEATGADANGEDASSYGLYISGLTVDEGASVTAKSGSADTTYGISNYGVDITVNGGTVTATAGDATGNDSYSYGIYTAKSDMTVRGTGVVDATGGKATNSSGIELAQGFSYDSTTGVTYADNGKLILSDSAKVTARSGAFAEGDMPACVGLICVGLSLLDSASLDAQGVNFGIRAAGFEGKDETGKDILSPSAISVSDSASLSAAASSNASPSFGLQGCATVDVSGGTAKFAGNTAGVYLYGEASNVTVGSGLTAATTPAGGTLKMATTYKSYTTGATLTVNETTGIPTNACTAVTIAKPAPASSGTGSSSGSTTTTTTNPDGSLTTVVTKPDGSTVTTDKQPDGVTTVTSADKSGKPTGVTVTVPDAVTGDMPVSIPADLGKADGAASAVITYPDGTKETVVGSYSDGKLNLNVGGSASIEILDDFVPLASLPLTDVPSDSYYYDAVIWAAMAGITGGKTAATFAPSETCTREQMVTILWRAAGSPKMEGAMGLAGFDDVGEISSYAYDAMAWAVSTGIVTGTSDTTLSPKATVSRAQAVTFLWCAAGKPVVNFAMNFTDVPENDYYTGAVRWAVSEKITDGTTTTTFSPAQNCTRAQVVTFLYRQSGK